MAGQVQGHCDPRFSELREEFERNFAERGEKGASVCLSLGGETLVDLWGGVADVKTGEAWREETVGIVFSCTKAATAICAHILVDRGELELQAPVSKYWPEFAKAGKEKTTVQMMLNHESGIPALREPVKEKGFLDWDYMVKRMEDEPAWWEPGTRNGYHMLNFGWTVGELVRRVSGKSLGQFFADEVAGPTGANFWIGLPDGVEPHIADILPYTPQKGDPVSDFARMLVSDPNSIQALGFANNGGWGANDEDAHRAEIGAAGGISNARGQVAMYTPLAVNDGSIVSRDRVEAMSMVATATQRDATLLVPTRFAAGFMKSMDNRGQPGAQAQSVLMGKDAFGHVGAGGQIGFADPECGMAFSYTMSQMGLGMFMNERGQSLIDAAYKGLGYRTNAPGAWVR